MTVGEPPVTPIAGSVRLASAHNRSLSVREASGGFRPPARAGTSHKPARGACCDDAVVGEAAAEVPLAGGFVARGVARVGDTVRRPLFDNTKRLRELISELEKLSAQMVEQAEGWAPPPETRQAQRLQPEHRYR